MPAALPTITAEQARRLAVTGQLLAEPRPASIGEVVAGLGRVQMDPTAAVARSERLALFSRLGPYDTGEIDRAMFERRELFEYWAYILPMADYALHRHTMRAYPSQRTTRGRYVREWMAANPGFRRHLLSELRRRGPAALARAGRPRGRALEHRRLERRQERRPMLDVLWNMGRIAIVGRDGNERIWDLGERFYPREPALSQAAAARRVVTRQLAARGIARSAQLGRRVDGPAPGAAAALRALERKGVAQPVQVEGLAGSWVAHAPSLSETFRGRTVLLSPFDQLVHDRERTVQLFGFRFRLEIYRPRHLREHGYFVLPLLHGDRLIGRIDPLYDRSTQTLHIHAVHAEDDAPATAAPEVAAAVAELAAWLGARQVQLSKLPARWRRELRAAL